MAYQGVPVKYYDNGVTSTYDVSTLDTNFNYVSGKWVSVKDATYGAKGDGVTDDTAAINAALASGNKRIFFPTGTYIVSSALIVPPNVSIQGEQLLTTQILRTPTHTQDTMVIGNDVAGQTAGVFHIRDITFNRTLTFNGGNSYSPGVSTTVDNRLTGGQSHLVVNVAQSSVIERCWFYYMPHDVTLVGCAVMIIRGCNFSGSIWDNLTAGLQEGIDQIQLKGAVSTGGQCTLINIESNNFGGGFASAARSHTIGNVTPSFADDIGPLWGIRVYGVEGLTVTGNFLGGHNDISLSFLTSSGAICTNIKVANNFFDGARNQCLRFDHSDAGGISILVNLTGNVYNCETNCATAIYASDSNGAASLYQATIHGEIMMASTSAPIIIRGGVGILISSCTASGYNFYGSTSGDPGISAGCFVVLGAASSDLVSTVGNQWGGAANGLSAVNNCQWGVNFNGAAPTANSSSLERSNGLGLAGGALVNIAQTYPV